MVAAAATVRLVVGSRPTNGRQCLREFGKLRLRHTSPTRSPVKIWRWRR